MQDRGGAGGLHLKSPDEISGTALQQERSRVKPQADQQPQKCPRCDSFNTKFCYYNNYSLSQPRYFCKTCRRYWTKGGTLRNVPVGGGCRKGGKRAKRSTCDNPSIYKEAEANIPATDTIGAIRPQFFPDHSFTGVVVSCVADSKISSADLSSLSGLAALPQLNHGVSLGQYNTKFGLRPPSLLTPLLPQQTSISPMSESCLNDTENWRSIGYAAHSSNLGKDGLLHLLPPFPAGPASTESLVANNVAPPLKSEPQTVYEASSASGGVGYWNHNASSSSVGAQWPEFSGYGPSNSFL